MCVICGRETPKICLQFFDRVQVLMGKESVSKVLDTLEHWCKLRCVALTYRYIQGKRSTERKEICPSTNFFNRSTWLSQRSHPIVLELSASRTQHYRDPTFFHHIPYSPIKLSDHHQIPN